MFSHQSLHAITKHLQQVAMDERLALIERIKSFINHLERSSHFNVEQHTKQSDLLEKAMQAGNDEKVDPACRLLSVRPTFLTEPPTKQGFAGGGLIPYPCEKMKEDESISQLLALLTRIVQKIYQKTTNISRPP